MYLYLFASVDGLCHSESQSRLIGGFKDVGKIVIGVCKCESEAI